jgi:hypothetical protein
MAHLGSLPTSWILVYPFKWDTTAAPHAFNAPFTVYHTNGWHAIKISFCECGGPAGGYLYSNQLLRSLWFPVSLARPRTAFTFAVLTHFHHLTLQGKTTAWDFYNSLLHETDNTGLDFPPVGELSVTHITKLIDTIEKVQ